MLEENIGLTTLYNHIKDNTYDDPRIHELRHAHEELDREVLRSYGWDDIDVPPFCLMNRGERKADTFANQVIDRLFELNAKRAAEEQLKGIAPGGGKAPKRSRRLSGGTSAKASASAATKIEAPTSRKNALQLQLNGDAAPPEEYEA
jgi:hypothetical protein